MYKNIVILTGAGISAESGIPVFRSESGLWEQEKIEDVACYDGFLRNKEKVHGFYNKMRLSLKSKAPNAAHFALAKLQRLWPERYGGKTCLVTQNIDDLHEKAGSADVVHMHGQLNSLKCESCGATYPFFGESSVKTRCLKCGSVGTMRPDIVWFGEMPYHMDEIERQLRICSLFVAIGTSGVVYPAAGFCAVARQCGALCLEFNLSPSSAAGSFHRGIYGKASQTVPEFVDKLLETGEA